MSTWLFILPIVLLYTHRVEGDFGEKLELNGSVTTPASSMDSGDESKEIVTVLPDNENKDEETAALHVDMVEDEYDPSTTTEMESRLSDEILFESDKIQYQLNDAPRKETKPPASPSGWNQIGSQRYARLRGNPKTSKFIESNRNQHTEETRVNPEPDIINRHFESSYLNTQNECRPNIFPTSHTPGFSNYFDAINQRTAPNKIHQNRVYQIEAARAYIKQIQLEQEYALKSNSIRQHLLDSIKHNQAPSSEWKDIAFGTQYLHATPQSLGPIHPSTPTYNFQTLRTYPPTQYIPNNIENNVYKYTTVGGDFNGFPNQFDDSSRKIVAFSNNIHGLRSPLQSQRETTQDQWNGGLHTNQWSGSIQQVPNPIDIQTGHIATSYPGPTSSLGHLPYGYSTENEAERQYLNHHGASSVGAQWRGGQPTKSWS